MWFADRRTIVDRRATVARLAGLAGGGFGMPLFVLSLLAPAQQSWLLRQFTRHYAVATRLAGVLLIVVGVSDLVANLAAIRLYF